MEATQKLQQLQRILSDYLTDESRVHEFTAFVLDSIIQNNLLNDRYVGASEELAILRRKWTVRLNALLQSKTASTRWAALRLIKVTCEQSLALYMDHVLSWSGQCLGFLARSEPTMVHTAAIEVLTLLFAKAVGKPEIQAEITSKLMPRYNQLLLSLSVSGADQNTNQGLLPVTLPALTANMERFPSNTRHVMDKIFKTCIIPCLEGKVLLDPAMVGEYLSTSSKAGGKASIPAAWEETVLRLIGTIHTVLDRLFDTVDEEDAISTRPNGYESLSPLAADHVEAFPVILRRLRYLMEVMGTCLTFKTEVAVVVPFGQIIQLVCRIFNVYEGCAMREFKPKNEYTCLMGLLPSLFISTNKLLASVIYCSHSGMAQLGRLLSRILSRLLTESKERRALRISVYNLMTLCLQQYGQTFASEICKALAQTIIQDIGLSKNKNTVDIIVPSTGKSGKKRRIDPNATSLLDGSGDPTMQQPSDVELSALSVAEQLLIQYGSSGMPDTLRTSLDTTVVARLLNQGDETDVAVKGKLYDYLLSSVLNPSTTSQSSLLPHAIRIFSAGANEGTQELRFVCSRALAICDLCIHTRLPPIQRAAAPVTRVYDPLFLNHIEGETNEETNEESNGQVDDEEYDEERLRAEPQPQAFANAVEASSDNTFAVKVSTASLGLPIPIPTGTRDSLDEEALNPPSTSVVEVYQSSSHTSTVVEKEVPMIASAMSDVWFGEDGGPVIDEDIEMLFIKTPSMPQDTDVAMSLDQTVPAVTAITSGFEGAASEDDVEDFLMPDIDMTGPDDDE